MLYEALFIVACIVVGLALEQWAPAQEENARASMPFNVAYLLLYVGFSATVTGVIHEHVTDAARAIPGGHWVPLKAAFPAAWGVGFVWLVVTDFFYYWLHRCQHVWLWWEHRLHHSDPSMNVTTTSREHWLEPIIYIVIVVLPSFYLFDVSREVVFAGGVWLQIVRHFAHLNSRMSLGPLSLLVANPRFHRIHHGFSEEYIDRNFAGICPLWDVIFGTYKHPERGVHPATGIRGVWRPRSLWDVLIGA